MTGPLLSRTRRTATAVVASVVTAFTLVIAVPTGRLAARTNDPISFDWSVPDRFGPDGLVGVTQPIDESVETMRMLNPEGTFGGLAPLGWPADFDACSDTPRASLYRWKVNGLPAAESTLCGPTRIYFPREGHYQVELTVFGATTKKELLSAQLISKGEMTTTQDVTIQDFLIIGFGDGHGSGEGNPNTPANAGDFASLELARLVALDAGDRHLAALAGIDLAKAAVDAARQDVKAARAAQHDLQAASRVFEKAVERLASAELSVSDAVVELAAATPAVAPAESSHAAACASAAKQASSDGCTAARKTLSEAKHAATKAANRHASAIVKRDERLADLQALGSTVPVLGFAGALAEAIAEIDRLSARVADLQAAVVTAKQAAADAKTAKNEAVASLKMKAEGLATWQDTTLTNSEKPAVDPDDDGGEIKKKESATSAAGKAKQAEEGAAAEKQKPAGSVAEKGTEEEAQAKKTAAEAVEKKAEEPPAKPIAKPVPCSKAAKSATAKKEVKGELEKPEPCTPVETPRHSPCHQSMLSGQALAALKVEEDDPKTSVTFIHLSCTGATISAGLLGSQTGVTPRPDGIGDREPQMDVAARLSSGRPVDAIVASIGGGDLGLARLLKNCMALESCFDPEHAASLTDQAIADTCAAYNGGMSSLGLTPGFICTDWLTRVRTQAERGGIAGELEARFASLPDLYREVQTAIASRWPNLAANRVFVTEYAGISRDEHGNLCGSNPSTSLPFVSESEYGWIERTTARLNQVINAQAGLLGWSPVTGTAAAFASHGYCAAEPWVVRVEDSIRDQASALGTAHPNATGHDQLADAISKSLRAAFYE